MRSSRLTRRLCDVGVLALLALLAAAQCRQAQAIIYSRYNDAMPTAEYNVTAPAADPGWYNVSQSGSSYLYLGNQWVITAGHVPANTLRLAAGEFPVISGTDTQFTNPTGSFWQREENTSGNLVNVFGPLSNLADVRMFRVNTDITTGLRPEDLNPGIQSIAINSSAPAIGTDILMIGRGNGRIVNENDSGQEGLVHYDVNKNANPWTWSGQMNSSGNVHGFRRGNSSTQMSRWGTNEISSDTVIETTWGVSDNNNNVVTTTNGGVDVLTLYSHFDRPTASSPGVVDSDEAIATSGDSGGSVFMRNAGGQWLLAGVMTNVMTLSGQAEANLLGRAYYGQGTAFADLSTPHYYQQIADKRAQSDYSALGDINLDGIVSGNGAGAWATDDVTAFVQGWLHEQADGDILSWKKGDLNQDGITDLNDFALLRTALGDSIATADLQSLLSGAGGAASVPEPGSFLLMLGIFSGLLWLFRPRRRWALARVRRHT